jgi:hypothetical protein
VFPASKPAFGDEIAFFRASAFNQQIDTRIHDVGIIAIERDLLSYNGCQVGIEGEHKVLDVTFLPNALFENQPSFWGIGRCEQESSGIAWVEVAERSKWSENAPFKAIEAEYSVNTAVVGDTKPADLVTHEIVVAWSEPRYRAQPKHSDLLINVA